MPVDVLASITLDVVAIQRFLIFPLRLDMMLRYLSPSRLFPAQSPDMLAASTVETTAIDSSNESALLVCSCGTRTDHPICTNWGMGIDTRVDLARTDEVVSKAFTGRSGRAMLVETCANVVVVNKDERVLATGTHVVGDISCLVCHNLLGWR